MFGKNGLHGCANRVRTSRVIACGLVSFALLTLAVALAIGCNLSKSRISLHSAIGRAGSAPKDSGAARTPSIEKAIDEARAYMPTGDAASTADFDPLVFEMLRAELIRALEARRDRGVSSLPSKDDAINPVQRPVLGAPWIEPKNGLGTGSCVGSGTTDRIVSAVPIGEAGRVTDLTYNSETQMLSWSYMNVGDYDSSGEVGIPDITMIAQNYLAVTTDGIGDDALEPWIDGDKNGEVGISDITPIAQGYWNEVTAYRILTSESETGEFSPIGELVPFGDPGVFPKIFGASLPSNVLAFVTVVPIGSMLEEGERGNAVEILPRWHVETVDSDSDVGEYTSIALDSLDLPHISYWDVANEDLKYAYYNGISWDIETIDSNNNVGAHTSISLDLLDKRI